MSWRMVVISNSAKLEYKLGHLVIRQEETKKIHLSEIHTLMIESTAVSLTAALLNQLIAEKVKVIFCNEYRNPAAELISCQGSHDSSLKIQQQIAWPEELKKRIWTEIVAEKIRKQRQVLRHLNCQQEEAFLTAYLEQLELGDPSNREGQAAKVYFRGLFGSEFNRKADCAANAALNYGYSLILSAFNREVVGCGYLTQLGISHHNRFNPFNLACDLMEPFRPIIDLEVWQMKAAALERQEKMELVDLLNREVQIDGRTQLLHRAISIYCHQVLEALNDNQPDNLRFYSYEL